MKQQKKNYIRVSTLALSSLLGGRAVKSVLFMLLSLAVFQNVNGQEVKWYQYSKAYESYVPTDKPDKKVSFFLPLNSKAKELVILSPEETSMFINNKLVKLLSEGKQVMKIDSLKSVLLGDTAFVTLYNSESLRTLKAFVRDQNQKKPLVDEKIRIADSAKDFYLFAIVFLMLTAGLIKITASQQSLYLLEFRQLILSQIVDNPFYSNSFFSQESSRFYLFLSFLTGLILLYYSKWLGYFVPSPTKNEFLILMFHWLLYSVGIYFIFYLKFIMYKLLTGVYNFRRYVLIQNNDFMRVSIIVSLIYFFAMVFELLILEINLKFLSILVLIILLTYLFTTFRKLNKLYTHTKIHLFSYLCISEIVPWILILGILKN